ncbi:FAD-linked oxidoreductase [Ganoderma leucocontextum]|nr:FAD-linked oxidoreductase [Ganoderma leucocontextum]
MSLARAPRVLNRFARFQNSKPPFRAYASVPPPRPRVFGARGLAIAGLSATTFVGLTLSTTAIYADAQAQVPVEGVLRTAPLSELVRAYVVYSLCSVPFLVDWSPTVLSTLLSIPGLKQVAEAIVRVTFFDQFAGGDEAEDAIPVLERLRAENKGVLFVYSVEVDEAADKSSASEKLSAHKQIVAENLHCIDVAADFEDKHSFGKKGKGTWVAIKLSAMVPDAESLRRLSKSLVDTRPRTNPRIAFPGCPTPSDLDILSSGTPTDTLTEADIVALHELRKDLMAIGERARARGIRITVDAEHSWYQPAIDAFALDMMRRFNKLPVPQATSWFGLRRVVQPAPDAFQPLIFNTFQGYLRRTPEYLAQSITMARAEGYALGVKLVRGAYHPHEIEIHKAAASSRAEATSPSGSHDLSISPDNMPPVWLFKDETDSCYDSSARLLISLIRQDVEACAKGAPGPTIGAMFGTHNWKSADLVIDELVKQGLATQDFGVVNIGQAAMERVAVAQLYGMSDGLTDHLVECTRCASPFVLKYLPYGRLSDVMPYLSRRAIENKSVLGNGGAAIERKRAASAIMARLFGREE